MSALPRVEDLPEVVLIDDVEWEEDDDKDDDIVHWACCTAAHMAKHHPEVKIYAFCGAELTGQPYLGDRPEDDDCRLCLELIKSRCDLCPQQRFGGPL